jgi:hypothetical protein
LDEQGEHPLMKLALALLLAAAPSALAQEPKDVVFQAAVPAPVAGVAVGTTLRGPLAPIKGAPYSATITNESVQTLADGNRIVQTSTGSTARDAQGRTRQDTILPTIGTLSAAEAPHLVFIQDPVAETSYTLNLTDKTAQKIPMPPVALAAGMPGPPEAGSGAFFVQMGTTTTMDAAGPTHIAATPVPGTMAAPVGTMTFHKVLSEEQAQITTEDLGAQTIEGVVANGVRATRTIPAGQIGNEKPIVIVTEVWTSPDLKTIVSSKRSDPRMGEQTFRLTNLVRGEPDASLFGVPPDFKIVDGPQHIMYRSNR